MKNNEYPGIGQRVRARRRELGMTQGELAEKLGYKTRSAIAKIESGENDVSQIKVRAFADALKTDVLYLMGGLKPQSDLILLDPMKIRSVPVFESVSAGFGAYASSEIVDYMPLFIESDYEADETICIKVRGDSMFPKIENGDVVQVHKQSIVDSGQIAVILLNGDEGLVKKVKYGDGWVELHSINPMYPVQRFEGGEIERLQIVGLVKKIIKEV